MSWPHWIIVPVVLPLLTGALMVLLERRHAALAAWVSLGAVIALLGVDLALLGQAAGGSVQSYLLGNWRAPFGIALALDRLSALMLILTALVGLAALLYARGGAERRGRHFHALFQFQLMGLNGAFLTADLFNLFVFFEVLLISSYGLLLHGAGPVRLRAAVHYVTFNLAGSTLFLFAVALLYGLTGTLNMADLALKVPALPPESSALLRSAALLLLVVFCVKAALLPMYFWLPDTYGAATAPVAALFAIMTKVGVYAIARMYTLVFGESGGGAADVAWPWLPLLALGTLALAAQGALAARRLRTLVAYLVVASAGTLLLAIGLGTRASLGAALFYLVNSTLVAAALFLLVDRIQHARQGTEAGGDALERMALTHGDRVRLGALFFLLAVAMAGLPPLGGFLGKLQVLAAAASESLAPWVWPAVWAVVLSASLAIVVALARAGGTVFWGEERDGARRPPGRLQGLALPLLSVAIVAVVALAGPLSTYTEAAATQLTQRQAYIDAVLGREPVEPLWNPRKDMKKPYAGRPARAEPGRIAGLQGSGPAGPEARP